MLFCFNGYFFLVILIAALLLLLWLKKKSHTFEFDQTPVVAVWSGRKAIGVRVSVPRPIDPVAEGIVLPNR